MGRGWGDLEGVGCVLVVSYGFWGHKTLRLIAAECSSVLGGLGGLGVRNSVSVLCLGLLEWVLGVLWGLMGSGVDSVITQ